MGPVSCGGLTLQQSVCEGVHLVERNYTGAVCAELQPVGYTHTGAGKKKSMRRKKELLWPDHSPHSPKLLCLDEGSR